MPQAIPIAMIAITVASTAYSVAGSIQSGQQQAAMAEAQGKQSAMQGEMANLQARSQAAEMQNQETRLRATQVAQAAANGVSLDSDSFLNVVAATASKAELDRAQVLRNGLISQAAGQAQQSTYSAAAGNYRTSGYTNAGASLLKGATSVAGTASAAGWFDAPAGGGGTPSTFSTYSGAARQATNQ